MKRIWAVTLLLATAPGWADLTRADWRVSRPIVLPDIAAPQLVYLPLGEKALALRSLSEYRIVRDGGVEVPYRMFTESGQSEIKVLPVRLISQGMRAERWLQATVDVGPQAAAINQVELRLDGDNFRGRVRVEGSHDRDRWWLVQGKRLVYRHEARFEQTTVPLPPHDYRYLRVTFDLLQGRLPTLQDVRVGSVLTIPRTLIAVDAKLSRREDTKSRRTVIELRMLHPTRDLAQARFTVQDPAFDRPVTIESAVDKGAYRGEGSGVLRRLEAGEPVALDLQIPRARRVRLAISNGNDRPLAITAVTLLRVRRGLVLQAEPAATYELWYGRPGVPEPVYDIQRLPLTTPPSKLPLAALGPEHRLPPKPPPPPPWSERHPALLWSALLAVVTLLAIFVVRAMRGAKGAPPQP